MIGNSGNKPQNVAIVTWKSHGSTICSFKQELYKNNNYLYYNHVQDAHDENPGFSELIIN